MDNPEESPACPKCSSNKEVRPKDLLIGKVSPGPDSMERAGFRRVDQLAVDECDAEFLRDPPLQQIISGFYCQNCGVGFVSDRMLVKGHPALHWRYRKRGA